MPTVRRHVPTFRIRYHECDAQGVLYNSRYLTLFDMALTELWRAAFGGYQAMTDRGLDLVVAEAQLRFIGSARFDDLVTVAVEVLEIGTTSMRTEYEVRRATNDDEGDELLVTGWLRHVMVELGTASKTPFPDDLRAALSEDLTTTAGVS